MTSFDALLRSVTEALDHLGTTGERLVRNSLHAVAGSLRRFSAGVVIAFVSGGLWATTSILWLLTIFFAVSPIPRLTGPMAITAAVSTAVSLLLSLVSLALLSGPREK